MMYTVKTKHESIRRYIWIFISAILLLLAFPTVSKADIYVQKGGGNVYLSASGGGAFFGKPGAALSRNGGQETVWSKAFATGTRTGSGSSAGHFNYTYSCSGSSYKGSWGTEYYMDASTTCTNFQTDENLFLICTPFSDSAVVHICTSHTYGSSYTSGGYIYKTCTRCGATVNAGGISYTVSFQGNGNTGGSMSNQSFVYGSSNKLSANGFIKTGYSFTKWTTAANGTGTSYTNQQSVNNLTTTNGATIKLYAQWTPINYTVAYNGNGNTGGSAPSSQSCSYGTSYTARACSYTKTGYYFDGWSTQPQSSSGTIAQNASFSNLSATNGATVTLYAIWKPIKYWVQYGGTGATSGTMGDRTEHAYGETFSLIKNQYKRTNYEFLGWSTSAADKEPTYTDGQTVSNLSSTNNAVVTLYAIWKLSTTDISFNTNGGSGGPGNVSWLVGSTQVPETPVRTGYTFERWNTASDGTGTDWPSNNVVTTDHDTYYAIWTPYEYKALLHPNGAAGEDIYQYFIYDQPQPLRSCPYEKTGYTFTGWSESIGGDIKYSDAQTVSNLTTEKNGIVNLYANWGTNTYTIVFDKNDELAEGSMDDQVFTYDQEKNLSALGYSKPRYHFLSWNTNPDGSGTAYEDEQAVLNMTSEDGKTITLYAQWEINSYSIRFNKNSNVATGTMPQEEMTVGIPKPLTENNFRRSGYTFEKWTAEEDGSGASYADKETVTDLSLTHLDIIDLYAQWLVNHYTIRYHANGGTGTMSDTPAVYDTNVTLASNKYSRTGYDFTGWNTRSDGTGTAIGNNAIVSNLCSDADGIITLYAQWKPHAYLIQFIGNGATGGSVEDQNMSYGTAENLHDNNYQKTGYTFSGWRSVIGGETKHFEDKELVNNLTTEHNVVLTMTAKWTANSYTVSFDKNADSAEGEMAAQPHTYDVKKKLSKNTYTREGYTFSGWNSSADGTGTVYEDEKEVKNLAAISGADVRLYAMWSPVAYTVHFDANTGTGTMEDMEMIYDDSHSYLPACTFRKTGHPFSGWNTQADGTGTSYLDQGLAMNLTSEGGSSVTLYAQWDSSVYNLHFIKNHEDATGIMSDQPLTYDIEQNINKNTFERTGYTFANWNTEANGAGTSFANGAKVLNLKENTGDILDLYAQWRANGYYVRFHKNNTKAIGTMPDQSFIYDNTPVALSAFGFSLTGYTFDKWTSSSDGSGRSFDNRQTVKNLTSELNGIYSIYAQWKPNNYTVRFDKNADDAAGSMLAQPFTYDEKQPLRKNSFTRTGYLFDGWKRNSDGSIQDYADQESVGNLNATPYGITNLYAHWKPVTYYLDFDSNTPYASGSMERQELTYDAAERITACGFEQEGYLFDGWNTEPDGSGTHYHDQEEVLNLLNEEGSSMTLYAQWQPNAYYVMFDGNGATSGSMLKQALIYDTAMNIAECSFQKTGYHFLYWATSADGTGSHYSDKEVVVNLTAENGATATLYAQWEANTYRVAYNKNATTATGTVAPSNFVYDQESALRENTYYRTGFRFNGWNTTSDGTGTSYTAGATVKNLSTVHNGTINLYAQWIPFHYYVDYNKNSSKAEGTTPSQHPAYDESIAVSSSSFTRTGYTFVSWNTMQDGSGTRYIPGNSIQGLTTEDEGHVTLYAQWRANSYTITYNKNHQKAEGAMASTQSTYDSGISLRENSFTRTGYVFAGWNTQADGSGDTYTDKQLVTNLTSESRGSITLYAQWQPATYLIRYNRNDITADGYMPDQAVLYDQATTLDQNQYTRLGYSFISWNTKADGSGDTYTNAAQIKNLSAVHNDVIDLYAQWGTISYFVAFDGNGNEDVSGSMATLTVAYDRSQKLTQNTFVRSGYVFNGWNTSSDGSGNYIDDMGTIRNLTYIENETVTLYAQWSPITYSIRYEANCPSFTGSMPSDTVSYGQKTTIAKCFYERVGYTFDSWNMKENGKGNRYAEDQEVSNLTIVNDSEIVLYAQWTPIQYFIEYDGNSFHAEGSMERQTMTYDQPQKLSPNAFVRSGYTFDGWSSSPDANGSYYGNNEDVCNLSSTAGEVINLYAIWSNSPYYVQFNANGGNGSMTRQQFMFSESQSLSKCTYTRSGYTFAGWNTDSEGTGTSYEDEESILDIADHANATVQLYAQWEPDMFEITYNLNGGTWADGYNPPTSRGYDEPVTLPTAANLTRPGFIFVGWYTSPSLTGSAVVDIPAQTSAKELYAGWYDLAGRKAGVSLPVSNSYSVNSH